MNLKQGSLIFSLLTLLIIIFYRYLSIPLQVYIPLLLGAYLVAKTVYLIYKRKFWEEIMRVAILSIALVVVFIAYYLSAFKFNDNFIATMLITIGWTFVILAFSGMVTWKRKNKMGNYKMCVLLLVYSIVLAIFCTAIAVLKLS